MKLTACILTAFLFTVFAFAQEPPFVTAQPNTIYVGADGKFEIAPDTALLQFNISVQDATSQAAFQHASKEVEKVREVLRANGVDPKSANFSFLAVQPIYDPKNPKHKIISYQVASDVNLKLKDFSKVAGITQQLADANVSEGQSLNYILENTDEAKSKAVEDAYRHARASAETLARAGGRDLGTLSYATIDTSEPGVFFKRAPMPAASKLASAPSEEFTPQTVTVTAHVNAVFNLK